jgi:hypothetical protein
VNSQLTPDFLACFAALPDAVKEHARKCYRIWRDNPAHPGLHFKKIHGQDDVYSVRIGIGWRAFGLLEENTISWFWIGSHSDYDKVIQ